MNYILKLLSGSLLCGTLLSACGGSNPTDTNTAIPLSDQPENPIDHLETYENAATFKQAIDSGQRVSAWFCTNKKESIQYTLNLFTDGSGFYREHLKGNLEQLFDENFNWSLVDKDSIYMEFLDPTDNFTLSKITYLQFQDGKYIRFSVEHSKDGILICGEGELFA